MSDDERYQIIGKVVSDHEAAKKHLAALQAKARSLAEFLGYLASALCGEASWAASGPTVTLTRFNLGGPVSGTVPTAEAITALLAEIDETRTRIAVLDGQRQDLGV